MVKKLEIIGIIMSLAGIVFKLLHLPGAGFLMIIGMSGLAMCYFLMSHPISQGNALNEDESKDSKDDSTTGILVKAAGMALSVAVLGILFKMQSYPGASFMLMVGTLSLIVIGVVGWFKYHQNRSPHMGRLLIRILVIGSLSGLLYSIPRELWLEIKYPDNPEYRQAVIDRWADPSSIELQNKEMEEYAKMHDLPYDSITGQIGDIESK